MPPAINEQSRLCRCKFRRCCDFTDPITGEQGKLLNARDYKAHQFQQQREDLRVGYHAWDAQTEALAVHQQHIEEQMESLTIEQINLIPSSVIKPNSDYIIDKKKRMAAHIGLILDEITAQQQTIRRLDLNPGPLKDSSLLDGLEMCTSVQGFVERSVVSLAPAKHGPTRKHPSIKTLTENAQTALDLLGIEVKNINDLYTKELKKRERVTSSAPRVYDSGKKHI